MVFLPKDYNQRIEGYGSLVRILVIADRKIDACTLTLRLTPNDSPPDAARRPPSKGGSESDGGNGSIPFNVVSTFHVESR
jgi:hypothetical protein